MKRPCVICKTEIEVPTLNTKYCGLCASVQQRKRANDWRRNNVTKREFDLFCLDCNETLPINAKGDKKYCNKCLRKRVVKSHVRWAMSRRKKDKLDKFYKNLRINFIESPYLKTLKETELIVRTCQ